MNVKTSRALRDYQGLTRGYQQSWIKTHDRSVDSHKQYLRFDAELLLDICPQQPGLFPTTGHDRGASSLTALRRGEMAEFRKLRDRYCRSSCWWQRFPVSVYREAKMAAASPPTLGWHWKRYEKDEAGNRRRGRGVGASWWTEAQLQLLITTGDLRPLDAMWNMFFFFYSFPLTVQMLVLYKHAYAVCACQTLSFPCR